MRRLINNTSTMSVLILLALVGGALRFLQLPVAMYPVTSKPTVEQWIRYNGLTQEGLREEYGRQIEQGLGTLDGIERVELSYYGRSLHVMATFGWGVDPDDALDDTRVFLDAQSAKYPNDWRAGNVRFRNSSSGRMFGAFRSDTLSDQQLSERVSDLFSPRLEALKGVADRWLTTFDGQSLRVTFSPDRALALNVSTDQVVRAIRSHVDDIQLGKIEFDAGRNFTVRLKQRYARLDQFRDVVVAEEAGYRVRLKDVARVEFVPEDQRQVFRVNGTTALIASVVPEPEANVKQLAEDFREILQQTAAEAGGDIQAQLVVDPAIYIDEAIENVVRSVLLGMLIAGLVVLLSLGSVRNTVVTGLSMPLSLVGGVFLMGAVGMEINLISMGAMALSVGMVVDGSIVVLENIVRHLEMRPAKNRSERLDVVLAAVAEVRMPLIASMLTTIIVFLPLPFTSPLASALLGDLAKVIVCVLVVSMLVTLVVIPSVALMVGVGGSTSASRSRGSRASGSEMRSSEAGLRKPWWFYLHPLHGFEAMLKGLSAGYVRTLEGFLNYRWLRWSGLGLLLLAMGGGYLLVTEHVGREIMSKPKTDIVMFVMRPSERFGDMDLAQKRVIPVESKVMQLTQAYTDSYLTVVGEWSSRIFVVVRDRSQTAAVKELLEDAFDNTTQMNFQVRDFSPSTLEIPNPPDLAIRVAVEDEEEKREILQALKDYARADKRLGNQDMQPNLWRSQFYDVTLDERRMGLAAQAGLQRADLLNLLRFSLNKREVADLYMGEDRVPIQMWMGKSFVEGPDDIGNLLVRKGDKLLPVRHFMDFERVIGWGHYWTLDGRSAGYFDLWVASKLKEQADTLAEDIKADLLNAMGPTASRLVFEDAKVEVNENLSSLAIAMLIAVLLIWMLISVQFGQMRDSLVIMLAIPLGFVGVAVALYAFSSKLSVNSMLGCILLCGTAVNNSIILADFFQRRLQAGGVSVTKALLEAAKTRFRPILITTATTILGMLPIALGLGSGGEILQPLGIAVSGGLGISTLLTLFVVPLCLAWVHGAWSPSGPSDEPGPTNSGLSASGRGGMQQAVITGCILTLSAWMLSAGATARATASESSDPTTSNPRKSSPRESSPGKTSTGSLEWFIEQATGDPKIQAQSYRVDSLRLEERQIRSVVLPSVRLSAAERLALRDGFGAGDSVQVSRQTQTSLRMSQAIPNPISLHAQWKEQALRTQGAVAATQLTWKEVRSEVQKAYFRVQTDVGLWRLAKENLRTARETMDLQSLRFERGLTNRDALERSRLTFQSLKLAEMTRRQLLEQRYLRLRQLAQLPGQSYSSYEAEPAAASGSADWLSQVEQLSTALPERFAYFALTDRVLERWLDGSESSLRLHQAEYDMRAAEQRVRQTAWHMMPDASIDVQWRSGTNNPVFRPSDISLSLSWEIFAGLRDHFGHKQAKVQLARSRAELAVLQQSEQRRRQQLLFELRRLQTQYEAQIDIVTTRKKLISNLRERFESGGIDVFQLNLDLIARVNAENALVELRQQIVEKLADASLVTSKAPLFRRLLGLPQVRNGES